MDGGGGIGRRLREVRGWRGLSLRVTAELAGLSAGHLSRIERGERPVDRRSTLEALAAALRVSPGELTGRPYPPADPLDAQARATVAELETALTGPALGDDAWLPASGEPWPQLAGRLRQLNTIHRPAADYASQGSMLPTLIAELHSAFGHLPAHRRQVLGGLLDAYHAAEEFANSLGIRGLPQLATVHARTVAEELDDPAALGLTAWLRAIVTGSGGRERVLAMCVRVIDELAASSDPSAAQVRGALHLTSALACAALNRADEAAAYLREADRIAESIPDGVPDFGLLYFGRHNVGIWRLSIAVELGEAGRVTEIARKVDAMAVPSAARQAVFYADLGRGLAADRTTRGQAPAMLRRAEQLAPHVVHNNPLVRECVSDLVRRAPSRELRGLAHRMGIAS